MPQPWSSARNREFVSPGEGTYRSAGGHQQCVAADDDLVQLWKLAGAASKDCLEQSQPLPHGSFYHHPLAGTQYDPFAGRRTAGTNGVSASQPLSSLPILYQLPVTEMIADFLTRRLFPIAEVVIDIQRSANTGCCEPIPCWFGMR